MTFTNSKGTRRCDASCHKARRPRCVCICSGIYHGISSSFQAWERSQKYLENSVLVDSFKGSALQLCLWVPGLAHASP